MKKNENHECAISSEVLKETGVQWQTDKTAILLDLKFFMKEYYIATFTDKEESLKLQFSNGQKFLITVTEIE